MNSGYKSLFVELSQWLFAFALIAASIVYFDEIRSFTRNTILAASEQSPQDAEGSHDAASPQSARKIIISAGRNGHFVARARVNGRLIKTLVDTGASSVALTHEDATSVGIRPRKGSYTIKVSTANGYAYFAPVRLKSVNIRGIEVRNINAWVAPPGKLSTTLLGMSFLSKLSKVEIKRNRLILKR